MVCKGQFYAAREYVRKKPDDFKGLIYALVIAVCYEFPTVIGIDDPKDWVIKEIRYIDENGKVQHMNYWDFMNWFELHD